MSLYTRLMYVGCGGSAPPILDLGTRLRGVVPFTPVTYRIGGYLGPITNGLRVLEKGEISCPRRELNHPS